MFLLDTMVLSELRKKHCSSQVTLWMRERSVEQCFLSVVSFFEIRRGICQQEKFNPVFAQDLSLWLESLREEFYKRILPVTEEVADEWAKISWAVGNSNADTIIAATAKVHNLTIATRNIKHFRPIGVPCVNPWE